MRLFPLCAAVMLAPIAIQAQLDPGYQVKSLRVEVLSTMLTSDDGIGEWGFSAVVDVDGHRILFDTGDRPDTVLNNAKELHVDLANITDVVLSHNHHDHTGGLMALRRALMPMQKSALARAHVGKGIFDARRTDQGKPLEFIATTQREYEATGGHFVVTIIPSSYGTASGSLGRCRANIRSATGVAMSKFRRRPDGRKTRFPRTCRW